MFLKIEKEIPGSQWLAGAKATLAFRDPVDALLDVEELLTFAQERLSAAADQHQTKTARPADPLTLLQLHENGSGTGRE